MSETIATVPEETTEYRTEHFTSREVHLIKSALMKEITALNSKEKTAKSKKSRFDMKTLKLETFGAYQKL